MYKIGDKVIHQREGACHVKKLVEMEMNGVSKQYYILEPVLDKKATLYIPADHNDQQRIRPVITRKQMKQYELTADSVTPVWNSDARSRHKEYAQTLSSFDFLDVLLVLKTLARQNIAKPLGSQDDQLFLSAQKLICSEIAIVLNENYHTVADKVNTFICA